MLLDKLTIFDRSLFYIRKMINLPRKKLKLLRRYLIKFHYEQIYGQNWIKNTPLQHQNVSQIGYKTTQINNKNFALSNSNDFYQITFHGRN